MPDLTPEQRAEQIVQEFLDNHAFAVIGTAPHAGESPTDTLMELTHIISTAFRAVEAATWEEAAKLKCELCLQGKSVTTLDTQVQAADWIMQDCKNQWIHVDDKNQFLAKCEASEFRRRATQKFSCGS